MNSSQIIILVVVIVVVAALAYAAYRMFGSRHNLHGRFGNEYDRVIAEKGGRAAGEAELRKRLKEHDSYQLREVTDEDRTRYRQSWMAVQKEFVDDPAAAVRDAEELVSVFVTDRGYPATDYDARLTQLSVEHSDVLDHYRAAHDVSVGSDAGRATTEELRQALVHYRNLFTSLIGADLNEAAPASPLNATATTAAAPVPPDSAEAETTITEAPEPTTDAEAPPATADDQSLNEVTVPRRRSAPED